MYNIVLVSKTKNVNRLGFESVAKIILRFKDEDMIQFEQDTMLFLLRKRVFCYGNYYVKVSKCSKNNESFMTVSVINYI